MRTPLALAAGLAVGAFLSAVVQGCANCTHTVHDVAPGTYRLEPSTTDDADYELVYTSDPPTVVETFTRNGTEYRNEYTASAPSSSSSSR